MLSGYPSLKTDPVSIRKKDDDASSPLLKSTTPSETPTMLPTSNIPTISLFVLVVVLAASAAAIGGTSLGLFIPFRDATNVRLTTLENATNSSLPLPPTYVPVCASNASEPYPDSCLLDHRISILEAINYTSPGGGGSGPVYGDDLTCPMGHTVPDECIVSTSASVPNSIMRRDGASATYVDTLYSNVVIAGIIADPADDGSIQMPSMLNIFPTTNVGQAVNAMTATLNYGNVNDFILPGRGIYANVKFTDSRTSTLGLRTVNIQDPGSGYLVGDLLTMSVCGTPPAQCGQLYVSGVDDISGGVTSIDITRSGSDHSLGFDTVSGGTGVGFIADVVELGSTLVTLLSGVEATPFDASGTTVSVVVSDAAAFLSGAMDFGDGAPIIAKYYGFAFLPTFLPGYCDEVHGAYLREPTQGVSVNSALTFPSSTGTPNGGIRFETDTTLYRAFTQLLRTDVDLSVRHLQYHNGGLPPIATAGSGAGTGAIITLHPTATDCKFLISVITGSSCALNSVIFHLQYGAEFTQQYTVGNTFSPASVEAARITPVAQPYIQNEVSSGFDFQSNTNPLTDFTEYIWNFRC